MLFGILCEKVSFKQTVEEIKANISGWANIKSKGPTVFKEGQESTCDWNRATEGDVFELAKKIIGVFQ